MAKKPGSIWIEVNELHYVDTSGNERYFQGDYWGPLGGSEPKQRPGSLWVGSDAYLYYVGGNGLKYRIPLVVVHNDGGGGPIGVSPGNPNPYNTFLWIEGANLYHGVNGGKFLNHYDHQDGGGGAHVDNPHGDGHTDGAHSDSHGDGHTDGAHGDSHTDEAHGDAPHYDTHSDYNVYRDFICTQYDHGNVVGHQDHQDTAAHTDGVNHCDTHDDYGHSDGAHSDTHTDGSHGDSHNDQHTDGGASHGDGHLDTGHQDHSDGAGGAGHVDFPAYIGP